MTIAASMRLKSETISISNIKAIFSSDVQKVWEFDMENNNVKSHWTGIFSEKDGQTEIDLTEDVTAKKLMMKPFVKAFLKKQQELYVSDLKKALQ